MFFVHVMEPDDMGTISQMGAVARGATCGTTRVLHVRSSRSESVL
jgi:hypothetical protein